MEHKRKAFFYPIFCPDDYGFNEGIASIQSFLNYEHINHVDVIVGGWCAKDEYWDKFVELTKDRVFSIKRFDKNYGKAYVINDLTKTYLEQNKECKYFLSCDSDIILAENTGNVFKRLSTTADAMKAKGIKFGYVSLQQLVSCCHLPDRLTQKIEINNETILWSPSSSGIAGGAIFVSVDFWKAVGGYRVMGVYAGDDGFLLYDAVTNGYFVGMIESISVIHPGKSKADYHAWKVGRLRSCHGTGVENLEKEIEEANKFWSNYKR